MWSIVSSMKLLRKPSKRGEGDIDRNKGSTASLKDHSKEANITHLDSDAQVNLDPSCSTDTNVSGSVVLNGNIGKSATLGSTSTSGSSSALTSGTKIKVERRESARLASSATKFLRSLRNHSGGGKLAASSVIAADDKHPINVIALKELDIETHTLNPRAAASGYSGGGGGSRGGAGASGKLPERSQSFNEKRLLVVTQNTSSENSAGASGTPGNCAQVKVKHSRAQSFVCNNSSNRNKSGYSIYLNQHHQFQSTQQNQANLAKQQMLFDQTKHQNQSGVSDGCSDASGRTSQQLQHSSLGKNSSATSSGGNKGEAGKSVTNSEPTSVSSSSRASNVQSCETIYENLEVILEEKQNKEQQMKNQGKGSGTKDYSSPKIGNISQSGVPASSKCSPSVKSGERQYEAGGSPANVDTSNPEVGSGTSSKTASSSSESLNTNMRVSGKDRPCQITRKYTKDSGYETSCSDYSNIALPKSSSVDSIISSRMAIDKQYQNGTGERSMGTTEPRSNRILNTSLYEELNVSSITEEMQNSAKPQNAGLVPNSGGSRKLRRSISEVPSERSTNLAKLQTKVGDSTARAMYTIANGLAVWTTEKSNSSLGLNAGGGHSGSTQTLHQYQNLYGCRNNSQLLHPQSVAPIPGGFSAAVQQASVYSTLPRNHTINSSGSTSSDTYGIYRGFQYRNIPAQTLSSQQTVSQTYQNYGQIAAKSTPSLRNAGLQEHHLQQKCFDESTDENKLNSSTSSSTTTTNPSSSSEPQQQQPIYQTIPVPTLSPARSTPNLGSAGANKLLQLRPDHHQQQYNIQGSIPQLSMVSSSNQHAVSTLGKVYQKPQQLHQKLYNHFGSSSCLTQQQSISSSVVQLQQLQSNDKTFAEPGRYPSTPNLQKSDSGTQSQVPKDESSYSDLQTQCNPSESHNFEQGSNSGSTNNLSSKSIAGAMSGSNDSATSSTPSCIGGNWNALDAHSILSNNNNNFNNNNSAPVRDCSSLKQIRYGPGHEKYPSWPIPVSSAQQIDPAGETHPVKLVLGSGSTRSKSWTEQTDYPKEKTPSYARPYMKRANQSYTQQLKTVMEKCERIPPEAYASHPDPQQINSHAISHSTGARHSSPHHHHQLPMNGGLPKNNEGGIVPPPMLYRDLMASQQNGHHGNSNPITAYNAHHHHNLMQYYQASANAQQQQSGSAGGKIAGEKEYMIPSPPERVIPEKELSKPLTQEDLELYTKRYEELITQYPQSEGYHSYISSDSSSYISSGTPFLDQLRRESETNQQFWSGDKNLSIAALSGICDPNDPLFGLIGGQLASSAVSGRESVTTVVTNSSSNSSGTETLKWHGSTSDISLSSGVGGNMHSSNFKHNSNHHSSRKNGSSMLNKGWNEQQQSIAHSSRLSTPQKQLANSPDNMPSQQNSQHNGLSSLRSKLEHLSGSPSLSKWHSGSNDTMELSGSNKNSNSSNNNNNSSSNNSNNGGNNPPNLKKFPLNTYTRPNTLNTEKTHSSQTSAVSSSGSSSTNSGNSSSSATSTPEKMGKLTQNFNSENSHSMKGAKSLSHSLSSPVIDTSKPPSVAERIMELEQQSHQQSGTSPSTSGTSSPKIGQGQSSDNLAFLASNFIKSSSLNNLQNSQPGMYMDESNNASSQQQQQQHQQQQHQQQNDWMASAQGNRANAMSPRGFMQSLSSSNVSKVASSDSGNNAAMSYSYLDPDKKHKVADMTLKAIQKKALLSYYERHKGKCANTSSASSVSSSDGTSSQADGPPEKDNMSFSGKSRLMLSLPKEHTVSSVVDLQQQLSSDSNRNGVGNNNMNSPSSSSSPSLSGLNRPYRAISISSGVSSSSSSSRSSSMSNSKVSSHSQHQQLVHGANNNISPKTIQTSMSASTGLSEDAAKQTDKSDMRQPTPNSSTPDMEPTDMYPSADSARLAYMSKYLPHLVRGDGSSPSSPSWSNNGNSKLPTGGSAANNGSSTPVTQEPAPIPPERPPKKPHLRNLAQQAHDESKDSKPPPPLPRAPVRPPTMLNNGAAKSGNSGGPPPIPSKPVLSVSGGGIGITRSPSPDELPPPPPPPPTEDMEVLVNDEPLPPPPTVSEVDVLFGSRTRSVTGLSSCLHKDSYMAQRKERTLGYEGRYRRTLSPSGLGTNNNNSKSSLESPSPGASDSVGSTRSMTNLGGGGKVDSSLSPAAWEKFHNIRPPSTTVIFTSNELAKGASSPTSSTAGSSTSGSPQPPLSQPLFHRSISCDSNIFNNKTGASQSSIPPPVAQVAPLRGSSSVTSSSAVEESIEKLSQLSLRNDVIPMCPPSSMSSTNSSNPMLTHTTKPCDNDGSTSQALTPERDNNTSVMNSDSSCENDERHYRDPMCQALDKSSKTEVGEHKDRGNVSNFALPSVIVPPLQYEKYERETRNGGPSVHSHHSFSESSLLKKSELSLRVNCTSVVTLQSEMLNGNGRNQTGYAGMDGMGSVSYPTSNEHQMNSAQSSSLDAGNKGCNFNSAVNTSNSTASFYTGRQKTQEELECEELSRDIAKQLPQGDKLQSLLVPLPDHKTTADYMEGLFHLELKLQPETPERRGSLGAGGTMHLEKAVSEKSQKQASVEDSKPETQKKSPCLQEAASQHQKTASMSDSVYKGNGGTHQNMQNGLSNRKPDFSHTSNGTVNSENCDKAATATSSSSPVANSKTHENHDSNEKPQQNTPPTSYRRCNGHAPLPADSAYFTTSESKAKFLTQYNNDIKKEPITGSTDGEELDKQKEELVSRISRKLEILRTEQLLLREEIQSNEQLGQMVVERVKQTAKRNEFDKFKLHVEEIEKITSLLLGISGRLARAENALMGLSDPPNPQEKKILESKRDKLREQLDEAKILKENIDRRSAQVSSFLQKYLTAEEYADYDHFVKMKAKLIIDAREIDDKIKLGEEQLGALKDALNTSLPLPSSHSS